MPTIRTLQKATIKITEWRTYISKPAMRSGKHTFVQTLVVEGLELNQHAKRLCFQDYAPLKSLRSCLPLQIPLHDLH